MYTFKPINFVIYLYRDKNISFHFLCFYPISFFKEIADTLILYVCLSCRRINKITGNKVHTGGVVLLCSYIAFHIASNSEYRSNRLQPQTIDLYERRFTDEETVR